MKTSFYKIIKQFEAFATAHNQVNDFGWGQLSEISTKDHTFPMIYVNPIPSVNEGRLMRLKFEIYIMDLLQQDKSNLLDVMNDTLLIGNDIIATFFDNEADYDFLLNENGIPVTPFEGSFDDHTAGWIYGIELEVQNSLSSCEVPLNLTAPLPILGYYLLTLDNVYNVFSRNPNSIVIEGDFVTALSEFTYARVGYIIDPVGYSIDAAILSIELDAGNTVVTLDTVIDLTDTTYGRIEFLTPYYSLTLDSLELTVTSHNTPGNYVTAIDGDVWTNGDLIAITDTNGDIFIDRVEVFSISTKPPGSYGYSCYALCLYDTAVKLQKIVSIS